MGSVLSLNLSSLCAVEGVNIFTKNKIKFSHAPSYLLIIGYISYWIELFIFKNNSGRTTPLAFVIFSGFLCWGAITNIKNYYIDFCKFFKEIKTSRLFFKVFLGAALFLVFLTLLCGFYASLFPPHLVQEFDAINYHMTIPRQHLLVGTFDHLKWSVADLYLLPIDYALAPYWLLTPLPNKIPQFFFFICLLLIIRNLVGRLSKGNKTAQLLAVLSVVASHNMGIQLGTAMLDVVLCYLFLAALDSFLEGDSFVCAIEFSFYFWAKSFIPLQMGVIFVCLLLFLLLVKKMQWKKIGLSEEFMFDESIKKNLLKRGKKVLILFLMTSLFVAGPFVYKTIKNAGTPLYPFVIGSVDYGQINKQSVYWDSLKQKTQTVLGTKDQYGSGRSLVDFVKHLWIIAVPEKGVNNRYDYPVGLMYLICVGPFLYLLFLMVKKRQFLFIHLFIVFYWITWWMGSHQSRFLFVPIVFMIILVMSQKRFYTPVLYLSILLSLLLVCVSVFRAHKADFGKSQWEVLRPQDKRIIEMSKTVNRKDVTVLGFPDVAFADFPVVVKGSRSVFVVDSD